MRARHSLLVLGWVLLPALAGGTAAPDLAESVIASMAQTPPASTRFIQVSYRGMLDRPLVASGTLRWLGGDQLERDITKPFVETAKIGHGEMSVVRGHGRVHRVALARVPQAGAMLAGFSALLSGDAAVLQQDFVVSAKGDAAVWAITLAPRTRELKRHLADIVVDGRGHTPDCLTTHAANGDVTITLLGAMANAGLASPAPQVAVLAAHCQQGP